LKISVVIHPEVQLYLHDEGFQRAVSETVLKLSVVDRRAIDVFVGVLTTFRVSAGVGNRRALATPRAQGFPARGPMWSGVSVASPARQAPELRKPRAQRRMTTDTFRRSWFAGGWEPAPRQGLAEAIRLSAWGPLPDMRKPLI
jgi:hypothetical protein